MYICIYNLSKNFTKILNHDLETTNCKAMSVKIQVIFLLKRQVPSVVKGDFMIECTVNILTVCALSYLTVRQSDWFTNFSLLVVNVCLTAAEHTH